VLGGARVRTVALRNQKETSKNLVGFSPLFWQKRAHIPFCVATLIKQVRKLIPSIGGDGGKIGLSIQVKLPVIFANEVVSNSK
jgi:hypothetical protein